MPGCNRKVELVTYHGACPVECHPKLKKEYEARYANKLLGKEAVIEEKIDGSQVFFRKTSTDLEVRSKGNKIEVKN